MYEQEKIKPYHEGDKMILSFDSQFLFQSGLRDCVAMLTVTFANTPGAAPALGRSATSVPPSRVSSGRRAFSSLWKNAPPRDSSSACRTA